MSASERTVRIVVAGRVQGVGFRMFVAREADRRGLRGWVRNRRDGAVEAVIAGPPAHVEEMIDALRRGPPASRVDAVEIEPATADDVDAAADDALFAIRPTA